RERPTMPDHGAPTAIATSRRWAIVVAVGLAVAAGAAYRWWPSSQVPPHPPDVLEEELEPEEPLVIQNPGYLGPESCAPCHAKRVAEFRSTTHFRACRRPGDGPMPPGFAPGLGTHSIPDTGLCFEMTQSGGEYYQATAEPTPTGERRSQSRID